MKFLNVILPVLASAFLICAATPVVTWATGRAPRRRATVATAAAAAAITGILMSGATPDGSGSWTETTAWVMVGVVLSGQVHIDLAVQRLPRQISHVGLVVVVALLLASPAPSNGGPVGMLVGAVLMWVITAGLITVSRHKLGRGDLHLSPLLGAVIGWFDPWGLLTAWLVTAVAGGAVAAVLLATGQVERDTVIPYGPFMVLGTVGAWMWVPV